MKMAKSSKEYTRGRIERIARDAIESAHPSKQPCLDTFIRAAILEGTARLKSSRLVEDLARSAISAARCGSVRLELVDLFVEPASYKAEMKKFEAEEKATEARRMEVSEFAKALIDDVMLDQYERGQDAIEKMMAFVRK